MLVMVVFFIAFRWIHLSTPLIRLFLLVLILLLMPTLNFLPVWFALSLLRFRLPSRLPMMFILWMVAMMVVIIPSRIFFQAEDGIRHWTVTGVQTCALPIFPRKVVIGPSLLSLIFIKATLRTLKNTALLTPIANKLLIW